MFLSDKTLQQREEVLQPDHSSRSGALGETAVCDVHRCAPGTPLTGAHCPWGVGYSLGQSVAVTRCTHSVPGLPLSCLTVKVPHSMDKETEAHRAKITGHPTSQVAELGLTPRPVAPG